MIANAIVLRTTGDPARDARLRITATAIGRDWKALNIIGCYTACREGRFAREEVLGAEFVKAC